MHHILPCSGVNSAWIFLVHSWGIVREDGTGSLDGGSYAGAGPNGCTVMALSVFAQQAGERVRQLNILSWRGRTGEDAAEEWNSNPELQIERRGGSEKG